MDGSIADILARSSSDDNDAEDSDGSSDSANPRKKSKNRKNEKDRKKGKVAPKLKNGYLPKGYVLSSGGGLVSAAPAEGEDSAADAHAAGADGEEGKGKLHHASETSISTTVEKLEGEGRRICVRGFSSVCVSICGMPA